MTQLKASLMIVLALFVSIFATFLALSPAWGQEVTATITGSVTDPSGAPVVGASVLAHDVERGTSYPTRTNDVGVFNLQRLPVGNYKIKVEATGFDTAEQSAITLVLNQIARFTFQLKVKGANEVMEVHDEAPALQTDSTQLGTLIDAKTNDNLPLASRNFVQLTLLTPGALTIDPQTMNTGSQTTQQIAGNGGGRPYINGNREQSNNFLLDGVDDNQASENAVGFTPSPDAIEEFNVITQNASAEFGNFQGGVVSASIKSGTNAFHGDVFEFIRNDAFNANSWANELETPVLPKAKMRWNMFGGTIGGPIVKNKLFFFADYQGSRFDHPPAAGFITVLTDAERGGNFSALPSQIYDPCVAGTGVSGTPCVLSASPVPFAGNIIPTNRLDGAFKALMASSLYPQPINNSPTQNAVVLNGSEYNDDQEDFKVDYNVSEKDRLFGRYSRGKEIDPQTSSFLLGGNSSSEAHIDNTAFDETHTFTPSLLNEFRVGVNYVLPYGPNVTFDPSVATLASAAGIAGSDVSGINGLPQITFTSASSAEAGSSGPYQGLGNGAIIQKFASTVWQISDSVLWSHGHHNLKFGYQMNRYRLNITYPGNYGVLGIIGFNSNYTSEAGDGVTGGDPGASFALGLPNSVGRGALGGGFHQRDWLLAGFVQDDWRVTDALTLNLGLRYEARTPWIETNNRQVNVNITTGLVEFAGNSVVPTGVVGTNGYSRGLYNSAYEGWGNYQPRIGFSWAPAFLQRKTVIRGAYGVSSYLEGTGTNLRLPRNPPYTPTAIEGTNVATSGSTPYVTEAGATGGASPAPESVFGATMFAWNPTVQPAIAQQWNFTIQHELAKNLTMQIGYVGQKATHLVVPLDLGQNQLDGASTPYIGGYNGPQTTDSAGNVTGGGFGPNSFADVYDTASVGTMRYDALQAVLQKRTSWGLEGQIAYTFGKCMTNSSGYYGTYSPASETTSSSAYQQNLYDSRSNWARCFYDSSQVLSAYALYELPVGHGKQFGHDLPGAVNAAVGNWSLGPIFSYHAGFPLALYNSTDNSGTFSPNDGPGPGSARPNCNGPVHYVHQVIGGQYEWFANDSSFSPEAAGTFGTCPAQGPVIGPHYVDVDFSLQKNFQFTETKRLQFRADFLNAFNHPNLAAPNTSYSPTSTNFGYITNSQDPRNLEFALKFYF
jgi:Carboxypeptidase regulatory-like domain